MQVFFIPSHRACKVRFPLVGSHEQSIKPSKNPVLLLCICSVLVSAATQGSCRRLPWLLPLKLEVFSTFHPTGWNLGGFVTWGKKNTQGFYPVFTPSPSYVWSKLQWKSLFINAYHMRHQDCLHLTLCQPLLKVSIFATTYLYHVQWTSLHCNSDNGNFSSDLKPWPERDSY